MLYACLWWHIRFDPSNRARSFGKIFAAATTVVLFLLGSVIAAGSFFNVDTALASTIHKEAQLASRSTQTPKTTSKPKTKSNLKTTSSKPLEGTLLSTYQTAAQKCNMEWETLAAVGWVESHHGQLVAPGVQNGANFAGAKGPMQFLSATWKSYGVDGNNDGKADVYNPNDAIHGAANYLCANGAGDERRVRDALWNYNHSQAYVDEVLAVAASYKTNTLAISPPTSVSPGPVTTLP